MALHPTVCRLWIEAVEDAQFAHESSFLDDEMRICEIQRFRVRVGVERFAATVGAMMGHNEILRDEVVARKNHLDHLNEMMNRSKGKR